VSVKIAGHDNDFLMKSFIKEELRKSV
jgi:hypothetical protein